MPTDWRRFVILFFVVVASSCSRQPSEPSAPAISVSVRGEPAGPDWFVWNAGEAIRVGSFDLANSDPFQHEARIQRADASSVVITQRDTSYGFPFHSLKLFLNPADGALIRRTEFPAYVVVRGFVVTNGKMCFEIEAGAEVFPACVNDNGAPEFTGEKRTRELKGGEPPIGGPPDTPQPTVVERGGSQVTLPALPQSAYDDFERLRPDRVQDGYTRDVAMLQEQIGPTELVGGRLWFGKQFYDGEGLSGVGGLGYFDFATQQFMLFHPQAVADWSVSALLVEPNTVWLGLVSFPEGVTRSGGLIQYEINSERTTMHAVEDIVVEILRGPDALYVGTSNGLYRVSDGRVVRYRF